MKWHHDRSSDAGIAAKISVLVETYSLFLIAGNPSLGLWNRLEILAPVTPGGTDLAGIPCIFPAEQG